MVLLRTLAACSIVGAAYADSTCGIGSSLLSTRVSLQKEAVDAQASSASLHRASLNDTEVSLVQLVAGVINGTEVVSDTMRALLDSIRTDLELIVNEVQNENVRDQEALDDAVKRIADCRDVHTLPAIPIKANRSDAASKSHETCRENQAKLLVEKSTTCEDYVQASSHQPEPPQCMCKDSCYNHMPEPDDFDTGLECLKQIGIWQADLYKTLSEKKQACESATQDHALAVQQCTANQTHFETEFCSYRGTLIGSCSGYAECRTAEEKKYAEGENSTRTRLNGRKAELKSVEHIRCLLTVFEVSPAKQPEKLEECRGVEVSDDLVASMSITYPEVPDEDPCDVSPVETYPCMDEWIDDHYKSRAWYENASTAACMVAPGCETADDPTDAPTDPPHGDDSSEVFTGAKLTFFNGLHGWLRLPEFEIHNSDGVNVLLHQTTLELHGDAFWQANDNRALVFDGDQHWQPPYPQFRNGLSPSYLTVDFMTPSANIVDAVVCQGLGFGSTDWKVELISSSGDIVPFGHYQGEGTSIGGKDKGLEFDSYCMTLNA